MVFLDEENWDQIINRKRERSEEPWIPATVELAGPNSKRERTDFFQFCGNIVCSERFWVDVFSKYPDALEGLELVLGEDKCFFINVFNNDSVVDLEKSSVLRDPFSKKVLNVLKYVFDVQNVNDKDIFRVTWEGNSVIVSHRLKEQIERRGATGIRFVRLPELVMLGDDVIGVRRVKIE